MDKWDMRWMSLARGLASWSKHPVTRVGCVVIDDDRNQLSGGYNGLPRGANDDAILDQSKDISITVHAEANAVAAAARNGHSIKGATVYVTNPVCAQCAALLIQAGVKKVVALHFLANPANKWKSSCEAAEKLFCEVGIDYKIW